jgi:hypothetical protein
MFMSGFPGRRTENARFGHAQAIFRRGEPVQFQWWVRVLSRNRDRRACYCGATGVYKITGW